MSFKQITLESIFKSSESICDEIIENKSLLQKIVKLSTIILLCSGIYGIVMGMQHSPAQALSSFFKVPLLFTITLSICVPALHFVGLLLGSRIEFLQSLTVLLMGIAITAVMLFAFASISLFFYYTGSSYRFLLILHVIMFAISGLSGLHSINKNFKYLQSSRLKEKNVRFGLLQIWMILYMFVGTQTAFVLSPFVGKEKEFFLFHHPRGNFYSYMLDTVLDSQSPLNPKKAERLIAKRSMEALEALHSKDFQKFSSFLHPDKGVILQPDKDRLSGNIQLSKKQFLYAHSENTVFKFQRQSKSDLDKKRKYTGRKKKLKTTFTFLEYYENFLNDTDYRQSQHIAYNEYIMADARKLRLNDNRSASIITVEYNMPGSRMKDGRWRSLLIVFSRYNDEFFITKICNLKEEKK